ncbi:MAG TPA: DUF268 domain-containing protein [Candidatus Paceibacterota bacterium]
MLRLTDPRRVKVTMKEVFSRIMNYWNARKTFQEFLHMSEATERRFSVKWEDIFYFGNDNTSGTGFNTSYIYHIAWAARILAKTRPDVHTDISSSLWFVSTVSAFIKMEFYDYRPANLLVSNLSRGKADLTKLHFPDNSISSLSCMHTVEHVGLGRYGDHLDPNGDLMAISELKRVVAHGGNLLFVVPIGKPIIHFNSHRIYSYAQIREYFKDYELENFYLIPDDAIAAKTGPIENATEMQSDAQTLGTGCFWFKKKMQ